MINSVRNTVQSVLNKNNYGYISPADFNLYALQAQMEFFEEYFSNYNKVINMENSRMSGTDYADIEQPIAEVMEYFMRSDFLVPILTPSGFTVNQFYAPSVVTLGYDYYMINKLLCYNTKKISGATTGLPSTNQLIDTNSNFITAGIAYGDIVINLSTLESAEVMAVASATVLDLSSDIFQGVKEDYTIYSSVGVDAEKVSVGKITMLNNSMLTAPSTIFPAYTLTDTGVITAYPNTIKGYGAVNATYFRYPKAPKWTYISLASGEPLFDQSQPDYQDFELPPEDEYKLAVKILQYCGITIREAEVINFAMAQEQHEQPSFSMQQ
jgi:hypothetical protein